MSPANNSRILTASAELAKAEYRRSDTSEFWLRFLSLGCSPSGSIASISLRVKSAGVTLGKPGTTRLPPMTATCSTPTLASLARYSLSCVSASAPAIVADVAINRISSGLTSKACITRLSCKASSAACEPIYVCASSSTIQRNLPCDFWMMGASACLTNIYSNMVPLVTKIGAGFSRINFLESTS